MGIIVDTQVLIALERSQRNLELFLATYPSEDLIAVASITASELLYGTYRANSPVRKRRREQFVEGVLARLPVLPFDLAAARQHAAVWADLTSRGDIIGPHDLLIGSTALANGCAVLTENVREFSRIAGLRVLQPAW